MTQHDEQHDHTELLARLNNPIQTPDEMPGCSTADEWKDAWFDLVERRNKEALASFAALRDLSAKLEAERERYHVLELEWKAERKAREELVAAIDGAKEWLLHNVTDGGYGFYRPPNPHDFSPDPECCSYAEITKPRAKPMTKVNTLQTSAAV